MFARYVALGDSSTEGLDDPDGNGGYRGWADRLAEQLAAVNPDLLYANLGVRGRLAAQVLAEQLPAAVALRPDIVTVFAGVNDLLRPSCDLRRIAADVEQVQRALVAAGATVLSFTMPDPSRVLPLAKRLTPRVTAFNAEMRAVAQRSGAMLVDFGGHEVAGDPRLWAADRLHANSEGHRRIAAALADALQLPDADRTWSESLDAAPRRRPHDAVRAEWVWTRRHLTPWLVRRVRGRSSGDGIVAKRPELAPLDRPVTGGPPFTGGAGRQESPR